MCGRHGLFIRFFFFNDTATTEIYTLYLHDALPISWPPGFLSSSASSRMMMRDKRGHGGSLKRFARESWGIGKEGESLQADRKSTRLNSSHANISYAVFCLKKKKKHMSAYCSQIPS